MRMGIGHPGHKDAVTGYVLHNFAKAEQPVLNEWLDDLCRAVPTLVEGDDNRVMSDLAR